MNATAHKNITVAGSVRVGVGILLLVAAGFKGRGLALNPLTEDSFLTSPRVQIAAIQAEILLGLWLVSGWARRAGWVAAVGFFGILAGVSLYQALAGQESCGCFGEVEVNPWATFGLDVGVVLLLCTSRPRVDAATSSVSWGGGTARTIAGAVVCLALIVGGFLLVTENPAAALMQLRGEYIVIEPSVVQAGESAAGETRTITALVANYSGRPVRLTGGTTSCSCVATDDLPCTVPPGGSHEIHVRMVFRGSPGRFQHSFILHTDLDKQPVVTARFAGRVVKPSPD